jgi:thymidylate synthase
MVNAWNVGELDQMVLPPCHYGFQVYTRELTYEERIKLFEEKTNRSMTYTLSVRETLDSSKIPTRAISLMWNQRSVDTFLGLPFNIASYGLLLEIIAKEVNMVPEELIGNLGDVHLYSNHIEQAKEQIGRELTHDEKVEYARSLYGKEEWWNINDKRVITVLQKKKQTREPFPLPTITLPSGLISNENNWDKLVFEDFYLNDYQSHPTIKAPLSN